MEEQKTKILINDRHEYDYLKTILGNETKHELIHSEDKLWTEQIRGTSASAIVDNGDGYEISGNAKPDKKGNIDYHYAQQLEILIRLANLEDMPSKYEMLEYKKVEF
jgi:hypothetical protein